MRILQIMNRIPWPLKDGGSLGYYNYVKGYHDAGVELTVCALNTNKHYVPLNQLPQQVKDLAHWHTVDINTDIKITDAFLNLFSDKSYNIQRFYNPEFEALLLKLIQINTYDIILFESIFVAPYIDAIKHKTAAKCILRQHNVEFQIWETLAQNAGNPLKKWYLKFLSKRMKQAEIKYLNQFDGLTTVTLEDANMFKQMGCTKPIFVSPFGIDMARLTPNHAQLEENSVFHLGSMEWLPNVQAMEWFLQEVWPLVHQEVPNAKFYLAGRGMPASFQKYATDDMVLLGEVEDAVAFMQQKQIMIVPLFAGSGIRVKILEGMALAKTIVSTPLGAQGIAVEDGKHLLLANDANTFAQAIIKLLHNKQLSDELGNAAYHLAIENYDNTKVISKVLSFYNDILRQQ